MVFASEASLSAHPSKYTGVFSNSGGHTVGERILDFECCDNAGELAEVLNGFTGVGMGGNGSLGYFNAKADWNIDINNSAHTLPSMKG